MSMIIINVIKSGILLTLMITGVVLFASQMLEYSTGMFYASLLSGFAASFFLFIKFLENLVD